MKYKGIFITFEGSEGSGKSTQARLLCRYLKSKDRGVLHIREPGGVVISEKIRRILLDVKNEHMNRICETLLYMAARAQLMEKVILPALKKGKIVICDRFLDSTLVYQGYGCGVDLDFIRRVGEYVTQNIQPHLTFLLDIQVEKGLSRAGESKDRIERRSLNYHYRVRQGYLTIARQDPKRIKVIKVNKDRNKIQETIRGIVDRFLGTKQ